MGVPSDDGGVVREQEAENLVADFAGELEEGEGHWWCGWCGWGKSRWVSAV